MATARELEAATGRVLAALDEPTRQNLGGIDLRPVINQLIPLLIGVWERACPRQDPEGVRQSLRNHPRMRSRIRNESARALREVHGSKRKIGKLAFAEARERVSEAVERALHDAPDQEVQSLRQSLSDRREG